MLAVLLLPALPCSGYAAADITLRGDLWCPYNCDPASDRPGFAVEIARAVFAEYGRRVDYQTLSWTRSIAETRAGRFTAIIGAIPSDAPDFIFPTEPIGTSSTGFAVRAGTDFRYAGPASFAGRVLGLVKGYAFDGEPGQYVTAHEHDRDLVQFVAGDDAMVKNLRKLLDGHIDLLMDDANVLSQAIADNGLSGRLALADAVEPGPVFIAFSPALTDAPELARSLSEGIARLRSSGRLATILARYHLDLSR